MWAAASRPLTAAEMSVVEQNAVALGISLDTLMEHAGRAVAEEATRHLPPAPARVAIVAGTGNNGGDGTCAAFYLRQWGFSPEVWLVRPPTEIRSRSARRCFDRIERTLPVHLRVPTPEELVGFPLVIDALLGTGQTPPLRPPIRDGVHAIRLAAAPVLSVDLPTGARDPAGLHPQWTVALTAVKDEMDPATSGAVTVRGIGIPDEAWGRTGPGEFRFFRPPGGARGRSGRLVVIGGGPYAGAPGLAALAALRSGAERATVLVPEGAAERVQSFAPDLVVRAVGSGRFRETDVREIVEFVREASPRAVAIGMGAGAHPETVAALRAVERDLVGTLPLLVDADGLLGLPTADEIGAGGGSAPIVATPNAGELHRVFGVPSDSTLRERTERSRAAARERRVFLLAKGDPDLLTDGTAVFENAHHHPAMTVAGAGDVLGGVVASLLAQGLPALHAARLGSYWAGEAGLRVAARRSFGLVASDLVEELPAALAAGIERVGAPG